MFLLLVTSMCTFIFLAFLIALTWWYKLYFRFKDPLKKFPEAVNLPFVGVTFQVRNTIDVYYTIFNQLQLMGRNVFTMLGPFPTLMTSDPKLCSVVLGNPKHINKPPLYKFMDNAAGNSLLLTNGNEWRHQRKLLTPALDYSNVMQNIHVFNAQSDRLVEILEKEVDKEWTEVDSLIEYYALLQTYETSIGLVEESEESHQFLEGMKCVMKIAIKRAVRLNEHFNVTYVFTRNFWLERRMLRSVFLHIKNVINQKRRELKPADAQRDKPILIDILLRQMESDPNITEDFIARQLILMVAAGFDTTATAIVFALYNLSIFPEVQQKAYEEVLGIIGNDSNNRNITHQNVKDMNYLDLVIKESMRIKTTVPFFLRILEEDVEFEGTILPKGLNIMMLGYVMHMDKNLYEDPEKFIPERFSKENLSGNRYGYVPFCGGVRNCIGQKYAMLAMKITLAKILLNYELIDAKHELKLACEITLRSKTGVRVVFRRRKECVK